MICTTAAVLLHNENYEYIIIYTRKLVKFLLLLIYGIFLKKMDRLGPLRGGGVLPPLVVGDDIQGGKPAIGQGGPFRPPVRIWRRGLSG